MYGQPAFDPSSNGGAFRSFGLSGAAPSSLRSSVTRPSGKSIYIQRKEYAEAVSKQSDNFKYRVEHLFTYKLDGQTLSSVDDCLAKLKVLNAKGQVWGQDMILQVQGGRLQLADIETKEQLDSLSLGSIGKTRAFLDACAFNSLLAVTTQGPGRSPKVFIFQCEEVGAEHIRDDLMRAVQHYKEEESDSLRRNEHSFRKNQGIGQASFRNPDPPPVPVDTYNPPQERFPTQWNSPDYVSEIPPPFREDAAQRDAPSPQQNETERNVEIFNHVINDLELFMAKVSAAMPKEDKGKKKKSKMKQANGAMPPSMEFTSYLQKVKYGFNLLGKLNGQISNPSAADYVHILFSTLNFVMPHCPPDMPSSVISPLLTEPALILLSQEVNPLEDQLWQSLGLAWNVPRSKWPNGNTIPPYIPQFYDGWQPPDPILPPPNSRPLSRANSQRYHSDREDHYHEPNSRSWDQPPQPITRSDEFTDMRVMYDFISRNNQELSVLKGDVVQVLNKSKQWWRVRNVRDEEGYVPHNLLEPRGWRIQDDPQPPTLNQMSKPIDVMAWLEYKGYSKITVRSLGVLNGSQLLEMTREDIRAVCPEEGAKVFFQLQAVKSTLALASESRNYPYNGR